jgi:hypothetical protein
LATTPVSGQPQLVHFGPSGEFSIMFKQAKPQMMTNLVTLSISRRLITEMTLAPQLTIQEEQK